MIQIEAMLEGLNDAQREAVLATEGPVLIIAGAGSGKTRVITSRVAYLIATARSLPSQIVAVTFTNKAAGEMKERIVRHLGPDAGGARIGTFHGLCLRILRREGRRLGLPPDFQVFDTADQVAVIKAILKDAQIDEAELSPRAILSRISHAKNEMISVEAFRAKALLPDAKIVARCYEEYGARLRKLGGVDFDDLILEALRLLENDRDVAERYARWTRYLLVDEYQDTNHVQYRIIRALSSAHRNVTVVGDEDQSIFSWRGADIRNIQGFESDFPEARLMRLERNYRSTKTILAAASSVIEKNERRHAKTLWTANDEGLPIHYHRSRDDRDEGEAIARIVASLGREYGGGEVGILYRTNNQSRLIEESLVRAGIPYRIVGSLRFYERKEIKDLLAYLRLLLSPDDDTAFARAVNTPARGIGKSTLDQLGALAAECGGASLHEATGIALQERRLPTRAEGPLRKFMTVLEELREQAGIAPVWKPAPGEAKADPEGDLARALDPDEPFEPPDAPLPDQNPAPLDQAAAGAEAEPRDASPWADSSGDDLDAGAPDDPAAGGEGSRSRAHPSRSRPGPIVPLITALTHAIGFDDHLEKSHPGDHEDRQENVEALVSAAAEYDEQSPGGGLQAFLDRTSLRGDTDDVQGERGVTLLTTHSAKGLEFSAVILAGLEEHLFPHIRSSESTEDLEEERRLCYVALTRARKRLILTNAVMRRSFGDFVENPPSRFIDEIPPNLIVYSESSPWGGVVGDPLRSAGAPGERTSSPSGFMSPKGVGGGGHDAPGATRAPSGRPSTSGGPWRGGESWRGGDSRRGGTSRRGGSGGSGGSGPGGWHGRVANASSVTSSADAFDDYAVGRIVTHPMFGRGMILHKEGAGDSLKLTIRFQMSGTRKILPRHTTLVVHD